MNDDLSVREQKCVVLIFHIFNMNFNVDSEDEKPKSKKAAKKAKDDDSSV